MRSFDEMCKTPGKKIRSKGKGKGLARGKGEGPIGIPSESVFDEMAGLIEESAPALRSGQTVTVKVGSRHVTGKLEWKSETPAEYWPEGHLRNPAQPGSWQVWDKSNHAVIIHGKLPKGW